MSIEDYSYVLSEHYDRALRDAGPGERPGIRRAFRRALRAASDGDLRPAVLLTHRYP
jgi:hypothetical protein